MKRYTREKIPLQNQNDGQNTRPAGEFRASATNIRKHTFFTLSVFRSEIFTAILRPGSITDNFTIVVYVNETLR